MKYGVCLRFSSAGKRQVNSQFSLDTQGKLVIFGMFSGVGKQMVNAEFSRIYRFVKLLVNEGFLAVICRVKLAKLRKNFIQDHQIQANTCEITLHARHCSNF